MSAIVHEGLGKQPTALRWVQLVIGITCMAMIANLQYGWTLFVNPIDAKFHWGRASIQVAFSVFVLLETWLVPVEGSRVDRGGVRRGIGTNDHSDISDDQVQRLRIDIPVLWHRPGHYRGRTVPNIGCAEERRGSRDLKEP